MAILGLAGFALIVIGAVLELTQRDRMRGDVPVRLVVTDLVRSGSSVNVLKGVYEVLDGPHKGREGRDAMGYQPPRYRVGDIIDGFVSADGRRVRSRAERRVALNVGVVLSALGVGALVSAAVLGVRL